MTDWPHAPLHRLSEAGAYMVTAGTHDKLHYFRSAEHLSLVRDSLLSLAQQYGWQLQAWAIFSNHYHFVAMSPPDSVTLRRFIRHFHSVTARAINALDHASARQIWFQYWDTHLTFERSYFARLNYVHQNLVRHGMAPVASAYPWCSAGWFERTATPAFFKTVSSFKIDQVNIPDEFDVECGGLPPLSEVASSRTAGKAGASSRTPK